MKSRAAGQQARMKCKSEERGLTNQPECVQALWYRRHKVFSLRQSTQAGFSPGKLGELEFIGLTQKSLGDGWATTHLSTVHLI